MTPKQTEALSRVSRYSEQDTVKWATASELCSTPGVMGSLVRAGLVNSTTQEDRPLHQGTIRYGYYQINDRGRAALQASTPPTTSMQEDAK